MNLCVEEKEFSPVQITLMTQVELDVFKFLSMFPNHISKSLAKMKASIEKENITLNQISAVLFELNRLFKNNGLFEKEK